MDVSYLPSSLLCFFFFLKFSLKDLPLIGLLLIAVVFYFIRYATISRLAYPIILLAGAALGHWVRFAIKEDGKWKKEDREHNKEGGRRNAECGVQSMEFRAPASELRTFLAGLVLLLVFSSWWHLVWWHLDVAPYFYLKTRWMGLWNNPNIYGMLMGAGGVLAAGLLLADRRWKMEDSNSKAEGRMQNAETTAAIGWLAANSKMEDGRWKIKNEKQKAKPAFVWLPSSRCFAETSRRGKSGKRKLFWIGAALKSAICYPLSSILVLAIGMMAVGLVMSYSRGAMVATSVGLLYLAWSYGKLKWRWVVPGVLIIAAVVCVFWHATADNGPWYL